MRLTSDFWVSALVRRAFASGGFAAVLRRGAAEAGAVFLVCRARSGERTLFGPASQTSYDAGKPEDRRFSRLIANDAADGIEARLEREQRFDTDIWIVEVETGETPIEAMITVDEG